MKKKEQHYLVIQTQYYVDPHGEPDEAGTTKSITRGEHANKLYYEWSKNKDKYLDGDEWTDEPSSSEDGYNSTCDMFEIKKITEDQAKKYKSIIDAYNKLK